MAQLDALIEKHGLNDPGISSMAAGWVMLRGDFGWSESAGAPVTQAIRERFAATFEITLFALLPVILGGVLLGIFAAVHHNDPWDHISRILSIIGWSFPTFVFGLIVLMIFYGVLGWFPPGRLDNWALSIVNSPEFTNYTGLYVLDSILNLNFPVLLNALRHLVAPVFYFYIMVGFLMRITRSVCLKHYRRNI